MTRIIAGFAGSLRLEVPGAGTRPTSDRVREAIFSALDARDLVRGARVLDLYAGSGALGLEAASRGAATVVLVEKSPAAVAVCRRNAQKVLSRSSGDLTIEVTARAVQAFLISNAAAWHVVFIDPPYDLRDDELRQNLGHLPERLADDAVVVIERRSTSPEPPLPPQLIVERRKDYGDTTLWWVERAPREPS